MGDCDAVQSFDTLKQVVRVSSTWMHWLLSRCSHPNNRDESTDTIVTPAFGPKADIGRVGVMFLLALSEG